jgi:hypothetical protein
VCMALFRKADGQRIERADPRKRCYANLRGAYMKEEDISEALLEQLKSVVSSYLDLWVTRPSLETLTSNILGQARIASLGPMTSILFGNIINEGVDIDEKYLSTLSLLEKTKRIDVLTEAIQTGDISCANKETVMKANEYIMDGSSQKYLMCYLVREYNWIRVSLLSASYISALILLRAVFESIIGLGTRKIGSMGDRIDSFGCLNEEGKEKVKKLWARLCAWCHPYGKWVKEVCPVFVTHKAIYHPALFDLCLRELIAVSDLLVVVSIEKFALNRDSIIEKFTKNKIDLSGFDLLLSG